jgi:predicted transposase
MGDKRHVNAFKIDNFFLIYEIFCEFINIYYYMKLTLKIKLLPTDEQANLLLDTMKEANAACNAISDVAWEKRIFNNFDLHHEVYHKYKALLNGVKLVVVAPAYTSQTCCTCKHIGKRTNKVFKCTNTDCKVDTIDADYNASKVISLLGSAVNQSEKSNDMCCSVAHVYSGLKPIPSLCVGE